MESRCNCSFFYKQKEYSFSIIVSSDNKDGLYISKDGALKFVMSIAGIPESESNRIENLIINPIYD